MLLDIGPSQPANCPVYCIHTDGVFGGKNTHPVTGGNPCSDVGDIAGCKFCHSVTCPGDHIVCVVGVRPNEKVTGSTTGRVVARVAHDGTGGDRTNKQFVRYAVCSVHSSQQVELTVSGAMSTAAGPFPTPGFWRRTRHEVAKHFSNAHTGLAVVRGTSKRVAVATLSLIVSTAEPVSVMWPLAAGDVADAHKMIVGGQACFRV